MTTLLLSAKVLLTTHSKIFLKPVSLWQIEGKILHILTTFLRLSSCYSPGAGTNQSHTAKKIKKKKKRIRKWEVFPACCFGVWKMGSLMPREKWEMVAVIQLEHRKPGGGSCISGDAESPPGKSLHTCMKLSSAVIPVPVLVHLSLSLYFFFLTVNR